MLPIVAVVILLSGCRTEKDPVNPARACDFTVVGVSGVNILAHAEFPDGENHVPFGRGNIDMVTISKADPGTVTQEFVDILVEERNKYEDATLTNWYAGKTFLVERNGKVLAAGTGTCKIVED